MLSESVEGSEAAGVVAEPVVSCRPPMSSNLQQNSPAELSTSNLHWALGISKKERIGVGSKPSFAVCNSCTSNNINPPPSWVSWRGRKRLVGDNLHNHHLTVTFCLERYLSLAKKVFLLLLM